MNPRKPKSSPADDKPIGPMNLELLEKLVKLMSANNLNTIELSDGDQRVLLERGVREAEARPAIAPVATVSAVMPPTAAAPAPSAVTATAPADSDAGLVPVKSPMVGTFYSRPSPEAKNFIAVGSVIDEETDVCIIEAMKVFNTIKAEAKGTVVKIMAVDGKPVEFGQVLFLVKP